MKKKLSERFLRLLINYCIDFLILIICFFNEFFDLFGQLNGSDCFVVRSIKPKHGPYHGPKGTLEVIMF